MSTDRRTIPFSGLKLRGDVGGRYHALRGDGELVLGEGQATLRGAYDPPGSAWIALVLTIITFGLVHASVAANWVTMAAGPGFLPWYLAVRGLRQKKIELPLTADSVVEAVLDPAGTLLAVRVNGQLGALRLLDGWLGLALDARGDAATALQKAWAGKLRQGAVKKGPSTLVLVVCLIVLFCLVVLLLSAMAAMSFSKYRGQVQVRATRVKMQQIRQAAAQRMIENPSCPALSDLSSALSADFSPNDAWGNPIRLTCEGADLRLRSTGPDGKPDTADDITVP